MNVAETVKAAARRVLPASVHAQLKGALRPDTLVPTESWHGVDRRALAHLSESAPPVGDYLEFGVFRGDSLICMDRARREAGLSFRLFGFDSFEGLPELAPEDQGWTSGSFRSNYGSTRRRLTKNGIDWSRTVLVKGWYDETLTPELRAQHELVKASADHDRLRPLLVGKAALELLGAADSGRGDHLLRRLGRRLGVWPNEARAKLEPSASSWPSTANSWRREFDSYHHTETDPAPVAMVFSVRRVGGATGA